MDFGCSRKISYSESLEYFESDFSYILQNNGEFSNFVATTDLIFNNQVLEPKEFIDISFQHANNDLLCSGVKAEFATLNLSLPYEFDINQRKDIISFLRNYLFIRGVKLVNAHTVIGSDFFISWTLISKKNDLFNNFSILNKNVFLSKPLGGSSSLNIDLMRKENDFILNYIDSVSYITDISGYGLYNELNSLSKKYKVGFEIIRNDIKQIFDASTIDCSIKRNIDLIRTDLSDFDKKVLFSSEFNGPLLIFSDLKEINQCFYIGKTILKTSEEWFFYE